MKHTLYYGSIIFGGGKNDGKTVNHYRDGIRRNNTSGTCKAARYVAPIIQSKNSNGEIYA